MKILLAQSYYPILDPKELHRQMPYPPLGTLFVATMLRDLGHELEFYDCMLADQTSTLQNKIKEGNFDLLLLYDDEFNYLTKMCLSNMRNNSLGLVKKMNKNFKAIIYSSDAMDHTDLYLRAGFDFVIMGEGEETVQELVDKIESDNDFSEIKGLAFLSQTNKVVITPKRPPIKNLDQRVPDPDYTMVNLDTYRSIWLSNHGYFSINVSTSRGCPFSCNWCAKPLYGRSYNVFSPQRIVKVMVMLKEQFGVNHIWFTDDIFGLKPGWLKEFSELCSQKGIRVPYKCLSRADLLIKHNTVQYLSESGCEIIWTGVESGSQKILNAMDKGITISQVHTATTLARKYGVKIAYFIQFGYLGELWEDIIKTRTLIKINLPDDIGISVSYPLPNTVFYSRVVDNMTAKTNWTHSDDLDLMFPGTYPPTFYKYLHRLVHTEYAAYTIIKKRNFKKLILLPIYLGKFVFLRIKIQRFIRREQKQAKKSTSSIIPLPIKS